jgi:stage V sporulation protein D (sporulation-specific penicillin-binding protein)
LGNKKKTTRRTAGKKRVTANRKKPVRKINYQMRKKLVILFGAVLLALVGLVVRITYINATSGTKYKRVVLSQAQQQYESRVIAARRGDIYDRNGNILATSNKVYNVILDCKAVNADENYIEPTIKALTSVLGIDEEDIRTRLTSDSTKESQYQIIKKEISMDDKKAFEEYSTIPEDSDMTEEQIKEKNNIQGVWFEEDYLRIYPFNELACDTIGFTLDRDVADVGLESYYNSTLVGVDGRQYGYFNNSSDVEQTIIEATNGKNIETSLDVGAQQIVEKWVNAFNEVMGAQNVGVIVEDPSTGEILAMDGGDRYDLNNPRDLSYVYSEDEIKAMSDAETVTALNEMWTNFCVTDSYEPGSVVKPIVMASALEKGKISLYDNFVCDGLQYFGDTMIKCAVYPDAHGTETLGEIIANSCNDGMMQIAAMMGSEQFIKAQSLFNFGSRTGIDLPNEGTGIIHTEETMQETELACSSFGQGFTCTMIQEINALCSVINGGYYYQPHLVTKITDSSGSTIKTITPTLMKQTISASISENIREYMALSVQQGTSRTSKVEGYSSGGKTGTAEKFPRNNGKYLVSFIGFAPVDDPAIVIYVVVDEPNVEDQASSTYAQYIAQAILSELLPYLNVTPDEASDGYVPQTELWEKFKGYETSGTDEIMDENGNLLDTNGNLIDWDGNRIDENGYLLDANGYYQVDENGEYIKSTNLSGTDSTEEELPEAVSNPNAPEPLQDDFDPIQGNDMESEGLTNEEAGLE